MEKIKKVVHQDDFEFSHSIFEPAYNVLAWVNQELKTRGIEITFDLNILDDFEEDEDE